MHFLKYTYILSGLFISSISFAQQDTINNGSEEDSVLEEMVITGQYNPQSINKSIYEVKVINRDMIDRLAGNTLADVLNQTLNINITPNAGTGKSGVGMFGLDRANFKILVDNVPLVNDEDFGSNADLTQINLDDIERVEIVEGAMGVDYGANAIAGVINIITKKRMAHKWLITPMIQEETIGSEYNWNTKGRHIQTLKIAHQLTDNLYTDVMYSRNDFKGHWNGRQGERYMINDSLRGYEWIPKLQQTAKGTISYRGDNFQIFFKTEYFNEQTWSHNPEVFFLESPQTATVQPYAFDRVFKTERFFNLLNASGMAKDLFRYDVSLSYQQQTRNLESYRYFIRQDRQVDNTENEYESRKVLYSRGVFSNFTKSDFFDFQIGYEINQMDGFTSVFANQYMERPVDRRIGSYDFFGSAEFNVSDRFSIRPGYRLLGSNLFQSGHMYSVSAKYILPKDYELRAVVGNSVRLPNFDELYTYFVDVNHSVQGNENLKAEQGMSMFLHLKKQIAFENGGVSNRISLGYFDVNDQIGLMIVNDRPLEYQYINVNTYKHRNISYMGGISYDNFETNLGVIFGGTSMQIDPEYDTSDYLYNFNINVNVAYTLPKSGTTFSLFYKYNGAQYQYVQRTDSDMNTRYEKGRMAPIQWFDATIRQSFFDKKLETTLGVRNIFNVTRIENTAQPGAAHSGPEASMLMGYGRSFFLRLLYRFTI